MLSITASTLRQYNTGLRLWWEFCLKKNNVDPFHITVPDVLTFLTFHFKKGASYGTLNSYRSAIAQIAGPEMGQDYRLNRFFKGVFSLRQPLPRYENMWDPGLVVNYLRSLDSDSCSLEVLTLKLVSLIALASGQRIQTLSLIDIDNITFRIDKTEIKIPHRIKTSAINKSKLFRVPFF